MEKIKNNYYATEWVGLTKTEAYKRAGEYEDEVGEILLKRCGFLSVIYTRDNIIAKKRADERGLTLPDLYGSHKNKKNYWVEVKRKNRRLKFNDTGLDVNLIKNYLKVQKEFDGRVVIVFKDNSSELPVKSKSWFKDVWYGGFLDELDTSTPNNPITTFKDPHKTNSYIKCFPLSKMKEIDNIWKGTQTHFILKEFD